uniref:F-box domain-containing protein n=1 Tax=Trichogramma kaykai TaxID=54128 RepID=A0ABD2WXK7_9HYME
MEPASKYLKLYSPPNLKEVGNQNKDEQKPIILTYDVLRIIFRFLSTRDLCSVVSTCRLWRDAANDEAITRNNPEVSLMHVNHFHRSNKINVNNLYDAKSIGTDLRIRPSIGLIFSKVQEENEWTPDGCYCQNLPTNSDVISIGGYDIVENETKISSEMGLSVGVFLPKFEKLEKHIYHLDEDRLLSSNFENHLDLIVHNLLPTEDEKSKCIIILETSDGYDVSQTVMNKLKKSYKPGSIALWGGICVGMNLCQLNKTSVCRKKPLWTAISLSSPTLQSYSIVLKNNCRKEHLMREKLENFKTNIQLKKYSVAFMFACCARLDIKDTEVTVFKSIFPNVPLVGLHGDGENGLDTLNKKREKSLKHGYSTVFMILTYE